MQRPLPRAVAVGVAVVVAVGVLAGSRPAGACTPSDGGACAGTAVTVDLAAGSLTISAPTSLSLSGSLDSSPLSATMSTVQVDDGRGTLAGWTVTATTSGDLTTSSSPAHTIALGSSSLSGPLWLTTGAITAGTLSSLLNVTAGAGGSLNPVQPVVVATAATGFGGGAYSFTPTVTLTVPPNSYAGDYSTTVTFTVTG